MFQFLCQFLCQFLIISINSSIDSSEAWTQSPPWRTGMARLERRSFMGIQQPSTAISSHQQPLTAERVELVLDHTRGSSDLLLCQTTLYVEPHCIGLNNWCKPQLLTFPPTHAQNVFTIACCPMSHIFWIQLNLKRSKTCQKNVMNVMNVK